jgi:ApbE superfamily uncharacterized protein (UPF0280 family)
MFTFGIPRASSSLLLLLHNLLAVDDEETLLGVHHALAVHVENSAVQTISSDALDASYILGNADAVDVAAARGSSGRSR